jgi:GldM C-terminal domain
LGITDTFTLHIQANKSPIMSSPEKIQQISSIDELFSTFSQKDWKPNCTVDRYTLYYIKHRQDPAEIICQGNMFDDMVKRVLAAAKKGDQYIFKLTNGNCASFSVGIHIE